MPPHALPELCLYDVGALTTSEPSQILKGGLDAVPLAISAPENFPAMVRGLLQLAPNERMARRVAMDHSTLQRGHRVRGRRVPR